jgi:hypothetical protein
MWVCKKNNHQACKKGKPTMSRLSRLQQQARQKEEEE